jgi:heat shock protein HtpX
MNGFRTAILLAAMTALFMVVGQALAGEQGMLMALAMAGAMNLMAWFGSGSMMLRMYGGQEVTEGRLKYLAAQLAAEANIPAPKVMLLSMDQPNAFATGRSPEHGVVAVSRGLVELLSERELAGVIAHELAHIKHRDTLTMTVTATLAGALGMLSQWAMFFGGGQRDGERGHAVTGLVVAILAPLAAGLVQAAISRSREFEADKLGAEITGDPLALASALSKIEQTANQRWNNTAEANPATAHLFIINPLHGWRIDRLFSTHPATDARIARLREMAEAMPSAGRHYQFDEAPQARRGPWG